MQGSNLQQIIRLTLLNNMVGCHFSHFFQVWPANCGCNELGSIREPINCKMIWLKDLGIQIESCMPLSCIYTLRIDNWAVSQIGDHTISKAQRFSSKKVQISMETCAKSHPQLFEHPACHLAALEALEVPQKTLQSNNEMKGQICEERMNTINLNSPYCELKYITYCKNWLCSVCCH